MQLANELSGCHEILATSAMLGSTNTIFPALYPSQSLLMIRWLLCGLYFVNLAETTGIAPTIGRVPSRLKAVTS